MPDTSTIYIHSGMPNMPVLNSAAGSLLAVLDLLSYGADASTLTGLTVSGGVATGTLSGPHASAVDAVIEIAGVTDKAVLNGRHRVSARVGSTVSFATTATDGPAAGTVTIKLAGAGWTKALVGTNKAAYRSGSPQAAGGGLFLRVDDTGGQTARVVGYEAMADVDTGTGPFPTAAQQSGGLFWPKAHNATGSRAWALVADERAFYLYVQPTSGNTAGSLLGFGDLVPQRDGDAWGVFLAGHATALYTGGAGCLSALGGPAAATLAIARAANGLGAAFPAYLMSALRTGGVSGHATGSQMPTYPNTPDGGLLLMPAWCMADGLRGRLPGLWHSPQAVVGFDGTGLNAAPGYLPVLTSVGGALGTAFLSAVDGWRA